MKDAELYKITLTAKSPTCVGSGISYTKKDYLYDKTSRAVTIIDGTKLINWLISCGKPNVLDEYEKFMLNNGSYLGDFFRAINIPVQEREKITLYKADASEAISERGTLMEIKAFMRDAFSRPYIPGSSLKGALRTVLLVKMLLDGSGTPSLPDDITRKNSAHDIEARCLNTLNRKSRPQDALNSIMSGVSISDSAPIDQKDIVLAKKIDIFSGGEKNPLNISRECVRPGTAIKFSLTLTPELCDRVTAQYIKDAVRTFGKYYKSSYVEKFTLPNDDAGINFDDCILLGGGAGYFSKNIIYPGREWDYALRRVSEMMQRRFRGHHHEKDIAAGVSPRALKYTEYRAGTGQPLRSYQFGICHFQMEPAGETK